MCSEDPQPKCANLSDPSEYVSGQNLGDSFPENDKLAFSEKVGFGMGQYVLERLHLLCLMFVPVMSIIWYS